MSVTSLLRILAENPVKPRQFSFSIIQKKVVSPNDFPSLEKLSETLLAFVDRDNQTAERSTGNTLPMTSGTCSTA